MDGAAIAATFCATLADEWARSGVTDAVVAPGSRSTPLALALARDERIRVHVHVDERSAGFLALGLGLASGRPAAVVTTSGTAAAELHPAVVEADLAGVPLLAVTTDRPPELHGIGAPQTVDQAGLYGTTVRLAIEPGVPRADAAWSWRSVAARAVVAAGGTHPGPVHLNLAFTEPLLGDAGPLPEGRGQGRPWHEGLSARVAGSRIAELDGRRGVVVAGRGPVDPDTVHDLADALRWPVLADPLSGARDDRPATIAGFDLLGRCGAWAAAHRPEAVIRVGAPPASKVLARWLEPVPIQVVVDPTGTVADPQRTATHLVAALPDVTGSSPAPATWRADWRAADDAVQGVLDTCTGLSEPTVARTVLEEASTLVVGSSMPVRDLECFGGTTAGRVVANRGANGIDGVVSTAVGVALAGEPTVGLLGDLSFLHDSNGLLGAAERQLSLTLVVVDNDGGGIFSFLPQATELVADEFERLFATPHGLDLVAVARAFGAEATDLATLDELRKALVPAPGLHVVVVPTDRQVNVVAHQDIYTRVAEVVGTG